MACAAAVANALGNCFNKDGDLRVAVVGSGAKEVAEFRVYSQLLRSWSKVFDTMLQHEASKIVIEGFSVPAVESFLRFLYCGDLPADVSTATEAAVLASKYGIQEPAMICEQCLAAGFEPHELYAMLEMAHRRGEPGRALKSACCKSVFLDPENNLKQACLLSPELLDEVLSSAKTSIGDYELAKLILSWPSSPCGHDVAALLQNHVQLGALGQDRYQEICRVANSAGLGVVVDRMWSEVSSRIGEWTPDLFHYLGMMWMQQQSQQLSRGAMPFVGCYLNLIPSTLTWKAPHPLGPEKGKEEVARNAGNMTLQSGESMTWFMPIHSIFVSGIGFKESIAHFFDPQQALLELHCSNNGVNWELLWSSERNSFSCRSRERVRYFKLSVKGCTYTNMLQIQGVVHAG